MKAIEEKRACLVYVAATAQMRAATRREMEDAGYTVCEVEVALPVAIAAQTDENPLPQPLADCIDNSELCVFLIPDTTEQDAGVGRAAEAADAGNKRIIGVVMGLRAEYPLVFDENAESMVRSESPRIGAAINGTPTWEHPNGSRLPEREIVRVRCQ